LRGLPFSSAATSGESVSLAVRQHVDGPVSVHAGQDGRVGMAAAFREVIHAQHGDLADPDKARISRISVVRETSVPRAPASLAPARPASASATASSKLPSSGVRR
jgi:hypothetical protein